MRGTCASAGYARQGIWSFLRTSGIGVPNLHACGHGVFRLIERGPTGTHGAVHTAPSYTRQVLRGVHDHSSIGVGSGSMLPLGINYLSLGIAYFEPTGFRWGYCCKY